jgi:hypothetical protein
MYHLRARGSLTNIELLLWRVGADDKEARAGLSGLCPPEAA